MKQLGLMQALMLTRKADKMTEKQRKILQQARLRELVTYVRNNSPYFGDLYGDIPDDFDKQLKELMKMGFGTVIVKETNKSRVEFNNLNGYFQFPKDEDVEV